MAVIEPNELRWLLTDPDASKQMHVVALASQPAQPGVHYFEVWMGTGGGEHLVQRTTPLLVARCAYCFGLLATSKDGGVTSLGCCDDRYLHTDPTAPPCCNSACPLRFETANTDTAPVSEHSPEHGSEDHPCPRGHGACTLLTSKTALNPNRTFYRCASEDCKYFVWEDQLAARQGCCFTCGASGHWSAQCPLRTVHRATPKVTRRPSSPPPPLRDGEPTALTPAQAERSSEGKRRALEIKSRSAAAQAVALAHAAASSEA